LPVLIFDVLQIKLLYSCSKLDLGCLIIGGMTVSSLKHKYEKMYTEEVAGVFALFTIVIALFTNPVIEGIKNLVG